MAHSHIRPPLDLHPDFPLTARFIEGGRLKRLLLCEGPGLYIAASYSALQVALPCVLGLDSVITPLYTDPRWPAPTMPALRSPMFPLWAQSAPANPDPDVPLARVVVLVDDGELSAASITSIACGIRSAGALRLVVASPWLPLEARRALKVVAHRVVTTHREKARYVLPSDPEVTAQEQEWKAAAARLSQVQNDALPDTAWS